MGSHKAPVFSAQVSPHYGTNYVVTGNDLNGKALNFIEVQVGTSNVQPGELGEEITKKLESYYTNYIRIIQPVAK